MAERGTESLGCTDSVHSSKHHAWELCALAVWADAQAPHVNHTTCVRRLLQCEAGRPSYQARCWRHGKALGSSFLICSCLGLCCYIAAGCSQEGCVQKLMLQHIIVKHMLPLYRSLSSESTKLLSAHTTHMQPVCCSKGATAQLWLITPPLSPPPAPQGFSPPNPFAPSCITAAVCMQEEACRLADQVHVLEDTRSRWSAEVAAKEASLAAKEEAMAADSRQRDADQRRRLAQEHQVCICTCSPDKGLGWHLDCMVRSCVAPSFLPSPVG